MFSLEQSIAEWRKRMLAAGIQTPVPLEELESHLRDEIEWQVKSGLDQREVFNAAIRQIGQAGVLKKEFKKVGGTVPERLKHFFLTLSGIPNSQLATNMNTSDPTIEPRWATYAKAGTFLFPALILWSLTLIFVLPKANEICQAAGTKVFGFEHAPGTFKVLANTGSLLVFFSNHLFLTGVPIILAFVLLERYFSNWARYRRLTINVGAFVINAAVLLSLALMIVSLLIAAPTLPHPH